jgi:hypothetical protein
LGSILKAAFANNLRNRGMGIEHHQHAIVLGDLNFRIDAFSRKEVLERIKSGKINELLDQDDLILAFDKFNFTASKSVEKFTEMLF